MVFSKLFLLIVLIFGVWIYLHLKKSRIKGRLGETGVAISLLFLPRETYFVLNNVTLKENGHTTQIDHIVISVFGIFVIETKNYKGLIYGNSEKDYWTQNIFGYRYQLYNPIMQNRNHIRFLFRKFELIRAKSNIVHPIVVFFGASRLQLSGDCSSVVRLQNLNSRIKSWQENVMSIEDCRIIAESIQNENITDFKGRREHRKNVDARVRDYENNVSNGICPHCGGQLMFRSSRFGNFYGCSNYPRCRYTQA